MSVLRNAQPAVAMLPTSAVRHRSSPPLVVDLEGTLLATNVTVESFFIFAKKNPLQLFRIPLWLTRGLAYLKQRLAEQAMPDVHTLPYRREVLAYLETEKQRGRKLILVTSADQAVARRIAEEIGLFDLVLASDGVTNLSAERKQDRCLKEFGPGGFVYLENGINHRSLREAAYRTIRESAATAPAATALEFAVRQKTIGWESYLRAVRPHHWIKNTLVFLPLIAAHRLYNFEMLKGALVAFVVLSMCASSVYLLNDLVDLDEDRNHPQKKNRMIASGQLPVTHVVALVPLLVLGASVLSLTRPPYLLATTWAYCLLMLFYCLKLRSLAFWDAIALALGYALRVIAGSAAVNIATSSLLLGSVFLLFLGLALLKRFAELIGRRGELKSHVRGYATEDSARIAAYGCLSSFLAMFGFGFYLVTDAGRYPRYELLWLFYAMLAITVARMWVMAGHGEIKSDPVSFALRDRTGRILATLMALTALAAA